MHILEFVTCRALPVVSLPTCLGWYAIHILEFVTSRALPVVISVVGRSNRVQISNTVGRYVLYIPAFTTSLRAHLSSSVPGTSSTDWNFQLSFMCRIMVRHPHTVFYVLAIFSAVLAK